MRLQHVLSCFAGNVGQPIGQLVARQAPLAGSSAHAGLVDHEAHGLDLDAECLHLQQLAAGVQHHLAVLDRVDLDTAAGLEVVHLQLGADQRGGVGGAPGQVLVDIEPGAVVGAGLGLEQVSAGRHLAQVVEVRLHALDHVGVHRDGEPFDLVHHACVLERVVVARQACVGHGVRDAAPGSVLAGVVGQASRQDDAAGAGHPAVGRRRTQLGVGGLGHAALRAAMASVTRRWASAHCSGFSALNVSAPRPLAIGTAAVGSSLCRVSTAFCRSG